MSVDTSAVMLADVCDAARQGAAASNNKCNDRAEVGKLDA